jgi:hypothetical protein
LFRFARIENTWLKNTFTRWFVKTYQVDLSEKTGRVWLDRNLGASEACKTLTDLNCYGDYYQWGRGKDGHQAMYRIMFFRT